MADEDERKMAERLAARERRDEISRQIHALLTAWQTSNDPEHRDLFIARWDTLWAAHHAAALQYEELEGLVSPELADLRWRDYRAFFTALAPVDPSVPLTESERATLDRLEAAQKAELDEQHQRRGATPAAIEDLRTRNVATVLDSFATWSAQQQATCGVARLDVAVERDGFDHTIITLLCPVCGRTLSGTVRDEDAPAVISRLADEQQN
jgi:hypothetical protein